MVSRHSALDRLQRMRHPRKGMARHDEMRPAPRPHSSEERHVHARDTKRFVIQTEAGGSADAHDC